MSIVSLAVGVRTCDRCGDVGNNELEDLLYWYGNDALHEWCIQDTVAEQDEIETHMRAS